MRLFVLTILFPLLAIAMLWRRSRRPLGSWIATLLLALAVTGFSVLAAPWGVFGIPARIVLVVLFLAAMAVSLRRPPAEDAKEDSPMRLFVKLLLAFFIGSVGVGVLRAHFVPPGAIDLAFPLRGGTFLVLHGGSTSAANTHFLDKAQRYAVDLVKLNRAGMQGEEIRGAEALSPCDGVVSAMSADHVVLRCGDVDVRLGELGSIAVPPGARLAAGQVVGRVGAGREAAEPHLHIHAERKGEAVPMRLGGHWLVRNDIVRR